jgi:hypothetical protein
VTYTPENPKPAELARLDELKKSYERGLILVRENRRNQPEADAEFVARCRRSGLPFPTVLQQLGLDAATVSRLEVL